MLLEKRKECNLETHFLFLGYEKAFGEVRRPVLLSIVQQRNIPNSLLTTVIKVNENNELKAKLNATVTQPIIIDKRFSQNPGKCQRKWYDIIVKLQLGCHQVAVAQYTFTHKQHTERHKTINK